MGIKKGEGIGNLQKTIWVFSILSVAAIAVNKIYSLFGHGVSSAAMTWMFLYPLLFGTLAYILILKLVPDVAYFSGYRLFYNIYNSGIAALTVGSFLKGILDIAGTDSPYTKFFYAAGLGFAAAGIIIFIRILWNEYHVYQKQY